MNSFIVGISTGNKDVKMSAGEIECSVLNFDFIKQCNNHGAQVNIIPQQNRESINLSGINALIVTGCLLYTSPSPRDGLLSRMPSSA